MATAGGSADMECRAVPRMPGTVPALASLEWVDDSGRSMPSDFRMFADGDLARRIIARAAPCEEEDELCRRFLPRVRHYGLRHLGNHPAASDLAQRVMLLTLEKLRAGEVREPDRIASFVLGSARLVAQSMRRTRRESPDRELDDLAAPSTTSPDELDRERLARCLEGLSERERSIMVLTFYREESATEIAEALLLSEGNVRVIRHRALERLRGCMDAEGRSR